MGDTRLATLSLNRLAFGPGRGERESIAREGLAEWLAKQLVPEPADPDAEERIAAATLRVKYGPDPNNNYRAVDEVRPLRSLKQPIQETWKLLDPDPKTAPPPERGRPRVEVAAATLIRAVYSRWQVREVLVDFWHNHFNVNAAGDQAVSVALPAYDRDVIRAHALGNFREFLEAVAMSTAMQVYLNNRSSRAGAANENYARELFELHTVGRDHYYNAIYDKWRKVPGALQGQPIGYIDQDVYEAARAFTGWTVEDGASTGPGENLPRTGKFVYVESWHDGYQKRVLGREFDPFQAPLADGRKVLDLVARHPATAQFVCEKLCRRLVSDIPPPSLVSAAAEVWTENERRPHQIAEVVRFIATSADFAQSAGGKVKRPLEVAATYLRATEIDFQPTEGLLNEMAAGGQRLFGWAPPTGHPDAREYWLSANAMRHRWSLVYGLTQNAWQTGVFDPAALMEQTAPSALEVARFWQSRLIPAAPSGRSDQILAAMSLSPTSPQPEGPTRNIVAALAMTPEFQVR
jgi:uncharacterized protein (DUF1800 family)